MKNNKIAVCAVKAYISKSILPTYVRFSRARSHLTLALTSRRGVEFIYVNSDLQLSEKHIYCSIGNDIKCIFATDLFALCAISKVFCTL